MEGDMVTMQIARTVNGNALAAGFRPPVLQRPECKEHNESQNLQFGRLPTNPEKYDYESWASQYLSGVTSMSNEIDNSQEHDSQVDRPSNPAPMAVAADASPAAHKTWLIAVMASLALILAGGILHGQLSNRWGIPVDVVELGNKLQLIPTDIGPWKAGSELELPQSTLTLLECKGYLHRTYVHQGTGEVINVAVTFGPKGPIAVHTPEVCYSSRDVTQTNQRASVPMEYDGFKNTFWTLGFQANTIDKAKLSVAYAWSDGGDWVAAERPRFWRTDYLYKIQTATQAVGAKEDSTSDFMRVFLPELRKQMRTSKS
jgi:hypothetical protein